MNPYNIKNFYAEFPSHLLNVTKFLAEILNFNNREKYFWLWTVFAIKHFRFYFFYRRTGSLSKRSPPLLQLTALKNENPTELLLFENLVGGLTLPRRKGGSHHEIMSIFKKCQRNTKSVIRRYIYYEYVWVIGKTSCCCIVMQI